MSDRIDARRTDAGHVEAYLASGSSPTRAGAHRNGRSSPKPTLHLVGVGGVGRTFLREMPDTVRLVAATDTSGTLYDPEGLNPEEVAGLKEGGDALAGSDGPFLPVTTPDAVTEVAADIVVDVSSTRFDRPEWPDTLEGHVLERGRSLVLAAKDALAARAPRWLDRFPDRLGVHAVLGGTGRLLHDELDDLREVWCEAALAGNASTTAILQAVEEGASIAEGIRHAGELGLLETDPELDLRGTDAAVKLSIVAGALLGRPLDPSEIPATDIRSLNPDAVRSAAANGGTTRLVGRVRRDGDCSLDYEALAAGSPLAVPRDRVAYEYHLSDGGVRLHVGRGLGASETARAVLADLDRIVEVAR